MNFKEVLNANKIFPLVVESSKKLKLESYVIGGYVRDLLLHRPSKDIDIVSVGSGIKLAQQTAQKIGNEVQVTVFKNFGTAMLRYNDCEIEFSLSHLDE